MKVLLCINDSIDGIDELLEKSISKIIPGNDLVICSCLEDSLQTLKRHPWEGYGIAVILATSREELEEFILIRNLMDGLSIILILPDRERETILRGHYLYPRFVTYADSDLKDITAVLSKMVRNFKGKKY